MADLNPAKLIGRAFSILGWVWVGFVIFGGIGLLRELGFSGGSVGGILGSVIPGFILIGIGRAITRRATTVKEEEQIPPPARRQSRPVPASRPAPRSVERESRRTQTSKPKPKPASRPAELEHMEKSLEELLGEMETGQVSAGEVPAIEDMVGDTDLEFRPMTSDELIADARRKWSSKKPGSSGS